MQSDEKACTIPVSCAIPVTFLSRSFPVPRRSLYSGVCHLAHHMPGFYQMAYPCLYHPTIIHISARPYLLRFCRRSSNPPLESSRLEPHLYHLRTWCRYGGERISRHFVVLSCATESKAILHVCAFQDIYNFIFGCRHKLLNRATECILEFQDQPSSIRCFCRQSLRLLKPHQTERTMTRLCCHLVVLCLDSDEH